MTDVSSSEVTSKVLTHCKKEKMAKGNLVIVQFPPHKKINPGLKRLTVAASFSGISAAFLRPSDLRDEEKYNLCFLHHFVEQH